MWPYLTIAGILALLAWIKTDDAASKFIRIFCLLLLTAFVGLRFEIGYDWVAYERLFQFIVGDWSLASYQQSQQILPTEFLYYYFNVLIINLGGSFEVLLFIMAVFNLFIIDRMCQVISPRSQVHVWVFYFCLAVLAIQFNVLRQALASSFVILSLLKASEKRWIGSAILFVVALGFHISVLMFLPIFIACKYSINSRLAKVVVGASALIFISGAFLGGALLDIAGSFLPSFLGSKADNYSESFASGQVAGVSPLALLLVVAYMGYLRIMLPRNRDVYSNMAIALTILVLGAHLAVSQFPSLWNRIMAVSLPWQLAVLWRSGVLQEVSHRHYSKLILGSAQIVAISAMAYQLGRPQSVPFVPYHSLVQVWIWGDLGDGRSRALYTIDQAQRQPG